MSLHETGFALSVEDNGCGFRFDAGNSESDFAGQSATSGNGLQNMARRLREVGGAFDLQSELKKGTRIIFHVPVDAASRKTA